MSLNFIPPILLILITFISILFGVISIIRMRVIREKLKIKEIELKKHLKFANQSKKLLAQETSRLEEIDELKSKFIANILHEFKTPLSLIIGPLSSGEEFINTEIKGMMLRNALRINKLVSEVLDISKLDSNEYKLELEKSDIISAIIDTCEVHRYSIEKKGLELNVFSTVDYLFMYFDKKGLEKVVSNLLTNAEQHTSEGGIKIYITRKKIHDDLLAQMVEIRVEDSGKGFEKKFEKKVFERFYQVDSTQSVSKNGTGIGLSFAKDIVELHGGKIWAESQPEIGSKFCFSLPIIESGSDFENIEFDKEFLNEDIQVNAKDSIYKRPKILIVENHNEIREFIRHYLERDYETYESDNGILGFDMVKNIQPDLVISDVVMPGINGYELCNQIKTDPVTANIPVILLSVKSSENSKLIGLQKNADDYITKPFSAREVKVRIGNLIKQRKQLIESLKQGLFNEIDADLPSEEKQFYEKLNQFFDDHLSDSGVTSSQIAEVLNISERQLQRKTKALFGKTPIDLLRTHRLNYSKKLIERRAGNMTQIAYMCGFNDVSYFSNQFKRHFGVPPTSLFK